MNTTSIFLIDEEATITGVYTEDLDLRSLGHLTVERASNVEFCSHTQEWEVRLPSGEIIASHLSREEAIQQEIAYLNARMWDEGALPR